MTDIVDELHDTGRLVHRDHHVQIKRQRLIEAANTITDLRALADDLAGVLGIFAAERGQKPPEVKRVLARYREARQR